MARRKRRAVILSDQEVREIRRARQKGDSFRVIAEKYGVSHVQVIKICRGDARKEVK